jgi:GNAT superfamily N-acetyltransferase
MSVPAGYRIRERRAGDDAALLGIENRAAGLFRDHGYPALADAPLADVAALRRLFEGNRVWIAVADEDGAPAGYAVAGPLGGFFHLRELSVDPAHGRRGVGAALVGAVCAAAQALDCAGVSLTTFRFVPFNRPFYERLGFSELALEEAPPALRDAFRRELPQGVDPQERLLMLRRVDHVPTS